MADIARLEDRVDKIEELTVLSLLENATEALTVVDSSGNPRTKAGFVADTFKDFTFSDVARAEYRASVSPTDGTLSPIKVTNDLRLLYDSANSTSIRGKVKGLAQTGDIITLPIDSSHTFIDQNLATETENVNPFAVITGKGFLELSPASDTYIERRRAPEVVVDGGTIVNTRRVTIAFSQPPSNWFTGFTPEPDDF